MKVVSDETGFGGLGAISDVRRKIKKPLDKQAVDEYNINVNRLCSKRLPNVTLKNNRHVWDCGRLFFIAFIFLPLLCNLWLR